MDIFEVHRRIMDDYASYIRSFVSISDEEMRKRVEQHLNDGHLWPEPLLTFNPSFAKVGRIEELVASGADDAQRGIVRLLSRKWYMRAGRDAIYKHVPGMFLLKQFAEAFPQQCAAELLQGEWLYNHETGVNTRVR